MNMTNNLPNVPVHDLIVHPRDKELVIGTHGRSIYIADVKHLQQMTDSLLAKNLQIFHLKTINHSSRWGKYNWSGKYEDIKPQEFAIPFYSKKSENATLKYKPKAVTF